MRSRLNRIKRSPGRQSFSNSSSVLPSVLHLSNVSSSFNMSQTPASTQFGDPYPRQLAQLRRVFARMPQGDPNPDDVRFWGEEFASGLVSYKRIVSSPLTAFLKPAVIVQSRRQSSGAGHKYSENACRSERSPRWLSRLVVARVGGTGWADAGDSTATEGLGGCGGTKEERGGRTNR